MAWDKLGLSRPTRSERLRVAAEVGDVRHLAALLEAGADVETVNEPRPAFPVHLVHVFLSLLYLSLFLATKVLIKKIALMCSKYIHSFPSGLI